jgi:hypothetical protein
MECIINKGEFAYILRSATPHNFVPHSRVYVLAKLLPKWSKTTLLGVLLTQRVRHISLVGRGGAFFAASILVYMLGQGKEELYFY